MNRPSLALLALLVPSIASASAGSCLKTAKQADRALVAGDRDRAWALAEQSGAACAGSGARLPGRYLPIHEVATDETVSYDVRELAWERLAVGTLAIYGPDHPNTATGLENLGRAELDVGDLDAVATHLRRALDVRERVLGDSPPTAWSLVDVGDVEQRLGDPDAAVRFQGAIETFERTVGPGDVATGIAALRLAGFYVDDDPAKALPLAQRALSIDLAAKGPDDPATADAERILARAERQLGKLDDALTHAKAAVGGKTKAFGADSERTALAVDELARVYVARGDYAAAEPLFRQSLATAEAIRGPDDPETALARVALGRLYAAMGRYDDAQAALDAALASQEKALGPDAPDVGATLDALAVLDTTRGRYADAVPRLDRALAIARKAHGDDHPDVAAALGNLGVLYDTLGEDDLARPLLERAVAIVEAKFGADSVRATTALGNLAALDADDGRLADAVERYRRVLKIREAALGPDHPDVAVTLTNLAGAEQQMGAYADAYGLLLRALDIRRAALGDDHPDTATTLHDLAVVELELGELDDARKHVAEALRVTEARLGSEHPDVATTLDMMAAVELRAGKPDDARPLYERALAIRQKAFGDGPDTATSLLHLAELDVATGAWADAAPLYEQAVRIDRATLGDTHPDTARAETELAVAYRVVGDPRELDTARQGLDGEETWLEQALLVAPTAERQAAIGAVSASTYQALASSLQAHPDDAVAAELAMTTVLRRRARSAEAGADLLDRVRTELGPDGEKQVDALRTALGDRDALARRGPGPEGADAWRDALFEQDRAIEAIEADLAARSQSFATASAPADVRSVAAAMPAGSALVEVVSWSRFDPAAAVAKRWGERRYAACVLRPDGSLAWKDLGPASAVDAKAGKLRQALVRGAPWETQARDLYAAVLAPVDAAIGGATRVYLAGEGTMLLVPPGLLIDGAGRRLGDRREVITVATGRELLRRPSTAVAAGPVVVSGVDYGGDGKWPALPGAAAEGDDVAKALGARTITGADATEDAIRGLAGPVVLHVATHGFFDDDAAQDAGAAGASRGAAVHVAGASAAPPPDMGSAYTAPWRSGIVLAGVNADARGAGYLTAAEVAAMDLRGTRLVVLSACETGVGAPTVGDGVQGLRYALVVAGSRAQVLSLWKVDDAATRALMDAFYRELVAGRPAGAALATAQREVASRPEWAHPRYWAAFTLSGDPDVTLSSAR